MPLLYLMNKKTLSLTLLCLLWMAAFSQSDQQPETDPIITNRISQWQDLKFGFMMHWGMYAQWEVVESWSICNESWINRNGADYYKYKIRSELPFIVETANVMYLCQQSHGYNAANAGH